MAIWEWVQIGITEVALNNQVDKITLPVNISHQCHYPPQNFQDGWVNGIVMVAKTEAIYGPSSMNSYLRSPT